MHKESGPGQCTFVNNKSGANVQQKMTQPDSRDISPVISTKFAGESLEKYESQVRMEIAAMEEWVPDLEEG